MPTVPHLETHFEASATVRDVVIGMADGLTVPFALAAGLSGTVASTAIVVVAGLAEIAAGSIAMGLGGYLAARTEHDHYHSERARELRETVEIPEKETEEVADVFRSYGMAESDLAPVVAAICSDQKRWVEFMMRFELGFEEPDPRRAHTSAITIAISYVVGGGDARGVVRLRLREGQIDGDCALPRRFRDRGYRRPRLSGSVRAGAAD